jgi:hypothetical protein
MHIYYTFPQPNVLFWQYLGSKPSIKIILLAGKNFFQQFVGICTLTSTLTSLEDLKASSWQQHCQDIQLKRKLFI